MSLAHPKTGRYPHGTFTQIWPCAAHALLNLAPSTTNHPGKTAKFLIHADGSEVLEVHEFEDQVHARDGGGRKEGETTTTLMGT